MPAGGGRLVPSAAGPGGGDSTGGPGEAPDSDGDEGRIFHEELEQEVEIDSPKTMSPRLRTRSGPAARRRAHNTQATVKPRNPFVEYDSREMCMMQERKWLQEDELYMLERKEDLRHSAAMKSLAQQCLSQQDLYEKRTFFGPHSVKLKAAKVTRGVKAVAAVVSSGRPGQRLAAQEAGGRRPATGTAEYRSAALTVKQLMRELESSQRHLGPTHVGGIPVSSRSKESEAATQHWKEVLGPGFSERRATLVLREGLGTLAPDPVFLSASASRALTRQPSRVE